MRIARRPLSWRTRHLPEYTRQRIQLIVLFASVAIAAGLAVTSVSLASFRGMLVGGSWGAGGSLPSVKATENYKKLAFLRIATSVSEANLSAAASATVATNKSDYLPGETVIITGSGWQAGETVALHIDESDGDVPWDSSAVADDSGNISNSDFVIQTHDLGVSFTLTATGMSSNLTARRRLRTPVTPAVAMGR